MIVYLVRHGDKLPRNGRNDKAMLDSGLTAFGKLQATAVGKGVRQFNIELIYSSPLTRAKETAELIASELNRKIIYDERLREHVADFESSDTRYLRDIKQKTLADSTYVPPSGESREEAGNRFVTFLNELTKSGQQSVCVVSHAIVIETVLARLCNYNGDMHDYLKTASVTAIEIGKDIQPRVIFANRTFRDVPLYGALILRKLGLAKFI